MNWIAPELQEAVKDVPAALSLDSGIRIHITRTKDLSRPSRPCDPCQGGSRVRYGPVSLLTRTLGAVAGPLRFTNAVRHILRGDFAGPQAALRGVQPMLRTLALYNKWTSYWPTPSRTWNEIALKLKEMSLYGMAP
jgi:hypothetical protein